MFDQQIIKKLESMLNQMNDAQKNKLNDMINHEDSMKKAIAGVDIKKAQQLAKNLNLNINTDEVNRLVEELKKNPDIVKKFDKQI